MTNLIKNQIFTKKITQYEHLRIYNSELYEVKL